MPTRCIVAGCSNTTKEGVSLHSFPKDANLRKLWTGKVKLTRAQWAGPTDSSVICSDHFEASDFEEGLWAQFGLKKQKRLKPEAIPIIKTKDTKDEEAKRKHKPRSAAEKRKKMRILEELLADTPGSSQDSRQPVEDVDDTQDTPSEDPMDTSESDIDMPGPSHQSRDDETPFQGLGVIPAMLKPAHCPATRSFGTQTRVPTRVKGIQATVKTTETGANVCSLEPMRALVTSRGTMTCKSLATKESGSSSPSSPESPKPKELDSPGYTPDDSESSDEESSPKKAKKKKRGRSPRVQFIPKLDALPHLDVKYIVFETQLMRLVQTCLACSSGNVILHKKVTGTHLRIRRECVSCDTVFEWESQPFYGSMPAGNVLLSAATLFAGGSATKTLRILDSMKIATICERTFFRHQEDILLPAIEKVWQTRQNSLLTTLRDKGSPLTIGGDGRADSPGHSAKYGAYTGIELNINKIVDLQLVQSNEVKNSANMELEGFKRLLQKLTSEGLVVGKLITDRHRQLAKYVRETRPNITHVYDVWHLAKGVRKKVHGLAKKKGCEVMGEWEQSVNNHMYWVASTTPEEEQELRVAKWTSLANHIQGVHEGHGELFPRCLHGDLEPGRRKKWLKPGTLVCEKFEQIIFSTSLLKDVKKMSSAQQTSSLESFHAVINHFAPKLKAYKYYGMVSRLHLAALHFNDNSDRVQATTRDGKKCYKVKKLKYRPGKATVTPFKGPQLYGYVAELMSEVARSSRNYKERPQRKAAPPSLISRFDYLDKAELIQQQQSRFNTLKK